MVQHEPGAIWSGDETSLDWRRLSHLLVWGVAAALVAALAVFSAQSEVGARRLASVFAGWSSPAPPTRPAAQPTAEPAPQAFDAEGEVRKLSETIRLLTADRDRLLDRIDALERNLEDVTGATQREATHAPGVSTPITPAPPPPAEAKPATAMPQSPSALPPARLSSAPPFVVGALQPVETEPAPADFGADIAGAPTMEGLRTLWSVLRSSHAQHFEGLRPVVAVRETRPGAVELRLVVGPLASADAADRLCKSLIAARVSCRTAPYEGQRLALR